MIRIVMNRLKHTVELELPTDYERVLVCLWKLGLDRDPRKYTLRDLKAIFHYDTPDEHQMIRMIESGDTLMFALISLHQMIAPPYSIAELLRGKISAGCYNTADEFYADLEKKVFKPSACQSSFFFPISAELVDKKGIARKAGDDVLLKYEYMVGEAIMRIASQSLYWKTELFSDVEGAYEKLLSACWTVERIEDTLYGHVSLIHTEPFTEEEIADLAEKIEMINSVEFAIRIYSLVPEDVMGFAQWEYAPMLSSRLPVFRFEFDIEYTSIQANCNAGKLVPWDTPGSTSSTVMTYKEGSALYWSPANEDGTAVTSAKILFTVMNGDTPVYQGNIYLDGSSGSDGRRIYNASLIGAGLYLVPNMENEGAVISARDPSGDVKQVQLYDLTEDKLEIPIEELGNYAFYTNSTKISVKVKSDQDFEGSFTLIDVSQNNAEIAWHDITIKDKSCDFTNLTSARIYRLEAVGLEGCTVIISEK